MTINVSLSLSLLRACVCVCPLFFQECPYILFEEIAVAVLAYFCMLVTLLIV